MKLRTSNKMKKYTIYPDWFIEYTFNKKHYFWHSIIARLVSKSTNIKPKINVWYTDNEKAKNQSSQN